MKMFRGRKYLVAIAALGLVFAGCKGESPTSPSTNPSGGGTTPPTTATVALTVSNDSPLVNSTSVITATVAQNGQPVANGTAVEFKTTLGTFTDANAVTTIRTTTNGVATATLTSSTAGTATVTVTVANVSKTATVKFSTTPPIPVPPDTAPAITGVAPVTGRPQGGETLTITGKNFRVPVRVLFDFGDGNPKEAFVVSTTDTAVTVLTPAVDLGTGQTKEASITLITEAGTTNEARLVASTKFTYQATVLTPKIQTVAPASGPIDGGTRVTIFGEGFQSPVQVFFGSAETQVISVTFSQIVVMSPAARDTSPDAGSTVTGPIDIKVLNINSGTSGTLPGVFRYVAKMQITAVGPTEGPFTGGTRVTIDGTGFNDPVAVSIGGVAAQPIQVTPTRILAITGALTPAGCSDSTGPVAVTNVDNGDSATATTQFIYRVPKPVVVGVSSGATAGGNITITVLNAYGTPRLKLGDTGLSITAATVNADGTTTYNATIPSTITMQTQACGGVPGASGPIPTSFDVVYQSVTTACTDTLAKGAVVNPPFTATLTLSPASFATFSAKFTAATFKDNPTPPPTQIVDKPASVTPSSPQTILVANTGVASLTINSVTSSGSGCAQFNVNAPPSGTTLGECDSAPVTVVYTGPTPAASDTAVPAPQTSQCTITLSTTAGSKTFNVTGSTQ